MNIYELNKAIKNEGSKAGIYPIHTDNKGVLSVFLMIPSNPKFGGSKPQMGKGGIDKGESPKQAALREGYEELGLLESNIKTIAALASKQYIGKKTTYNLSVYVAVVKDPTKFAKFGWESSWAGWMNIDEAIQKTRNEQAGFLQQVKARYEGKMSKNINEDTDDLMPMLKQIKADCQPYLNAIGDISKYKLFRGTKSSDKAAITSRVRLHGRKPTNSNEDTHNGLNAYFKEKFGAEYRNALFVSSDPDMAKDYGNLYLVFPIGKFSFLWSPKVKDLYYQESDILSAIDDDTMYPEDKQLEYHMGTLGYTTDNLKAAIQSGNEIMIRCESWHGINLTELFDRDDYDDDSKGNVDAINTTIAMLKDLI